MGEKVKFDKCCIRKCNYLPESIKLFGLDLCFMHQKKIDNWLFEKGYPFWLHMAEKMPK